MNTDIIDELDTKFRNKVSSFLDYCDYIYENSNVLTEEFELDEIQIKNYKLFLIKSLEWYNFVLNDYIKRQVKLEYKIYEMILDEFTIENMSQMIVSQSPYITDIKDLIYKFSYDITYDISCDINKDFH